MSYKKSKDKTEAISEILGREDLTEEEKLAEIAKIELSYKKTEFTPEEVEAVLKAHEHMGKPVQDPLEKLLGD